jgi:phage-related protein
LFQGRISEIDVNEQDATLQLAGELDPSSAQIPQRKYSALCVWDFKDANCGYVDGVDPDDPATGQPFTVCPKDLPSCMARGRQQRFPGFLTITRDLTEAIEGNVPDPADDQMLSELYD